MSRTAISHGHNNQVIEELIDQAGEMALGPALPDVTAHAKLTALAPQDFAAGGSLDRNFAQACLAGLWLLHNYFDESHSISQSLSTPEGSYWHGILHRREPDYDNAKYWFRRVGSHPIHDDLLAAAREMAAEQQDSSTAWLATADEWDAFRFVDLCRSAAAPASKHHALCRRIQQREWELLFDYCCKRASGGK